MLATQTFGAESALPPLLIVHGLFGSGRNWGVIAKRLSDSRRVVTVDLRNHGESFSAESQSYEDMAADLAEVIENLGPPVDIIGHSMGGKASMVLALTHPDLVRRLMVADIAPVAYSHGHVHAEFIDAMQALDLEQISTRAEADAALAPAIENPAIRAFLLQSLDVRHKRWRLNLDALAQGLPKVMDFPEISGSFPHPTLFLSGANSDYVLPEHRPKIKALFPEARFAKLPGTGHWLHAEKPREFEATARAFLSA